MKRVGKPDARYDRAKYASYIEEGNLRTSFDALRAPGMEIRQRYNRINMEHGHNAWDPIAYMAGGYGDAGSLAITIRKLETARGVHADEKRMSSLLGAVKHEVGDLIWVAAVISEHYGIDPVYPAPHARHIVRSSVMSAFDVIGWGGELTRSVMANENYRDAKSGDVKLEVALNLGGYLAAIDDLSSSYQINPVEAYFDTMDELHGRLDAGKE